MPTEREAIRAILDARPDLAKLLAEMVQDGRMGCTENIDPNEPITVVAGSDHGGVTGSQQRKCGNCGSAAWLSPSTLEMLEKRGDAPYEILCFDCVMKRTEKMDAKER
jgi:hypothetical protein